MTPLASSPRKGLHERSQSQNNTLAIRVVPYSPPRPNDGGASTVALCSSRTPSRQSRFAEDENAGKKLMLVAKKDSSPPLPHESPSPNLDFLNSPALSKSRQPRVSAPPGPAISGPSSGTNLANIPAINAPSVSSHIRYHYAPTQPEEEPSAWAAVPLPRRRTFITIHSDKTFSLIPQPPERDLRSPQLSLSTNSVASDPFTDEYPPSSPLTILPEDDRDLTTCALSSSPLPITTPDRTWTRPVDDHSPWNYRMVGGLRKVPKTPNLKRIPPSTPTLLQSSPSTLAYDPAPLPRQRSPPSESSSESLSLESPASESVNYRVYASSLPPSHARSSPTPSLDESNYQVVGYSSSPTPSVYRERPPSDGSDDNYVVHAQSSPSSSIATVKREVLHQEYSQESLVVRPLRPRKRDSNESLGYYRKISRESLRRAGSLKSISSVLTQEVTHSIFLASPAAVYLQGGPAAFSSILQDSRTSTRNASNPNSSRAPMIAHPHQWSSQLSTVLSESEAGSSFDSRAVSAASQYAGRSIVLGSSHSRNMLSVSSSIDSRSMSHSRSPSDSLDRPTPSYSRFGTRDAHQVRDQDEHGDGLTELHVLHQRPSRTRLSGLFSGISSDRNLHSSSSSFTNSLPSSSLPTWARLYYGSGERRFLAQSSESMFSDYSESRPPSSFRSGSPTTEHFPAHIQNHRRRPRDGERTRSQSRRQAEASSASNYMYRLGGGLRKQTSSIWSPHLRQDQRASRYSMWEPPATRWSEDGGALRHRNTQVVLFVVGFVFPFAWMVGACLPLPRNPSHDMEERDASTSHFDLAAPHTKRSQPYVGTQSEGVRWWRRLNRYMSAVGLLVLAAVIVLVVLGVRQGWGS